MDLKKIRKLAFVLVLLGTILVFGCSTQEQTTKSQINTQNNIAKNTNTNSENIRTIEIESFNWGFNPSEIKIKKGETVKFKLTSISGTHGINVPELGIIIPSVSPGKEQIIEFTATNTGEFPFACNVYCGEGHINMRGKIIIE